VLLEWFTIPPPPTIADGIRLTTPGALTFPIVRERITDIALVSDDEVRQAMGELAREVHIVAEPSGAISYAAWRFRRHELPEAEKVVCIITGGNVDASLLKEVLS